jgi:hypothetical protein
MPGSAPAVLSLPQPLTLAALGHLEQAVCGTLGMLRRDLRGAAGDAGDLAQTAHAADAGAIEYDSWMPDAGAIEYASWAAQLRASQR